MFILVSGIGSLHTVETELVHPEGDGDVIGLSLLPEGIAVHHPGPPHDAAAARVPDIVRRGDKREPSLPQAPDERRGSLRRDAPAPIFLSPKRERTLPVSFSVNLLKRSLSVSRTGVF